MPAQGQVVVSSQPLGNVNAETAVSSLLFAFAATNDFQLGATTPPSGRQLSRAEPCQPNTKHLSAMRDEADAGGGCYEQAAQKEKTI